MKKIGIVIALLMSGVLLFGCAGGGSATEGSIEEVLEALKEAITEDLREIGFTDADFDAEELPGYIITDILGEGGEYVLMEMDKGLVEEGYIIAASMMLNSDQVIVIKAASGKVNDVKAALEAEHAAKLALWEDYLADQAEKVRNTIIEVEGDFIYYITYPDAEGLEEVIIEALQ